MQQGCMHVTGGLPLAGSCMQVGLNYICATAERFFAVGAVLASMVTGLAEQVRHLSRSAGRPGWHAPRLCTIHPLDGGQAGMAGQCYWPGLSSCSHPFMQIVVASDRGSLPAAHPLGCPELCRDADPAHGL
jgi:hypothetical protein